LLEQQGYLVKDILPTISRSILGIQNIGISSSNDVLKNTIKEAEVRLRHSKENKRTIFTQD
jgi:hypothetical protein